MAGTETENTVLDLNINAIKRTEFRINGDDTAILKLNLSDLSIGERLETGYARLQEIFNEISKIPTDDKEELKKALNKVDQDMREQLDYIFDADVSGTCGRDGTMYDLKDGEFRFETILNTLTQLYKDNLNDEYLKMKKRVQQRANNYVGTTKTKSRKRG